MQIAQKFAVIIGFCALQLIATEAEACSGALASTPEAIRSYAGEAFRNADMIVDATVIDPMNLDPDLKGAVPAAALTVTKAWKGEPPEVLKLEIADSCDIAFVRAGQMVRLLLRHDSKKGLEASMSENGWFASGPGFDAEIDRLVGQVRPENFVNLQSAQFAKLEIAPQSKHPAVTKSPFKNKSVQLALLMSSLASALLTWLLVRQRQRPNSI